MFRLVALIAGWSHDYWIDINHEDPELREPDTGPNHYRLILVRSWNAAPSADDVEAETAFLLHDYLPHADGHDKLHTHAVLDEHQWRDAILRWSTIADRNLTEENAASAWSHAGRWRPVSIRDDLLHAEAMDAVNHLSADVAIAAGS